MRNCATGSNAVWEYPCDQGWVYVIGNECWECLGGTDETITLAGSHSTFYPPSDGCCACLCGWKNDVCTFICQDQGDGTGIWVKDKQCTYCSCPVSIEGSPCNPGSDKSRTYCCG